MPILSEESKINNKYDIRFEENTYSTWDLDLRDLPPRSSLFSLTPINVGNSNVESILSYIARMAFEYLVSPYSIIKYVIDKTAVSWNLTKHLFLSKNINGMGSGTEALVDILQDLTARNDLYFTTLLGLRGKIFSANILKKEKAWCSHCFAEQMNTIGLNFEKLTWTLQPVNKCYQHQISLENKCSNCNEVPRAFCAYLRPGYCSNCFKWLGDKESLKGSGKSIDTHTDLRKESLFEELITQSNLLKTAHGKSRFPQNLARCISQSAHGSIFEFSSIVGIPSYRIRHLLKGEMLPTWSFLINISEALGVSILDLLVSPQIELSINSANQ